MRTKAKHANTRRGSAMVLVLLAIALAFVMGLTFLAKATTLTQSAETIADHARARQIAESGLMMAIHYVRESPDWRVRQKSETWVESYALHGGTVTIDGQFTANRHDPLVLTAEGYFGDASHRVEATLIAEHQPFGLAVSSAMTLSNDTVVDSFNSSEGPYGTGDLDDALVATNAVASGGITLNHTSAILGNVYVGVGGDPATVISDPAKVSGVKGTLTRALESPPPAAMPTIANDYGDKTYYGAEEIADDRRYGRLEIASGATLRITDHVTLRVDADFNVNGTGQLVIEDGASLRLYVGEDILLQNSARVNADGDAAGLIIFGVGSGFQYMIQNSAVFSGVYDAPASALKLQHQVHFYGVAMVERLEAQNDIGGIHIDRNPALIEANPRLRSAVARGAGAFRVVDWTDH